MSVLQAAEKLMEKSVVVIGREEDAALVKEAAEAAKGKWKQAFKHEAPQINVSTDEYLPSGSKGKSDDDDVTWYCPLSMLCIRVRHTCDDFPSAAGISVCV